MEQRKKRISALLLIIVVVGAVAYLRLPHKREIGWAFPARPMALRPVSLPPENRNGVGSTSRILSRTEATQQALQCLTTLCETGAADDSLSLTHAFVAHLDRNSRPFAKSLSALLKSILAYQTSSSATSESQFSRTKFPLVPRILADRAAAACDARGRRRTGEIVLSFAGDCTFGTVNGDNSSIRFPCVYRQAHRVDYPFALVRPWFLNDDLTVVNFECTLTDAVRTANKQWHFKGNARYAAIFPAGAVDLVGLSNNHSFDYRQAGFSDTITNFRDAHVPVFYQNTPYVTTLQGVQTVIIGDYTVMGENTTAIDGVPERVISEIKRYKTPNNIVVVVMHWGSELDSVPRPWQQALGRKFIDAGADAVVGHHPHVVQGIELYKGKYIAYSLGNFAFGGNSLARNPETFVLRLRFRAQNGQTRVLPASIVPCRITSSQVKNEAGIVRNNYQPEPVFGKTAAHTASLVLARSARLAYGVKKIDYLWLP